MDQGIPQVVKDFAAGISEGGEVQNRYWIALAIASFFVLVPGAPTDGRIQVPFGLPDVEATWFALFALVLLSALSLTFAAAQAHLVRSLELAHQVLRDRKKTGEAKSDVDERDLLSVLTRPSLDHVSSLAYVFRGYDVFFHSDHKVGRLRNRVSLLVFIYLKSVVTTLWLLLPAGVLCVAMYRFRAAGPPSELTSWLVNPIAWLLWISALYSLAAAVWLQIAYVKRAVTRLWKES